MNPLEKSADLLGSHNKFALKLWQNASKSDENQVMSPWSVYNTLMLALAGARKETAQVIRESMFVSPSSQTDLHLNVARLGRDLLCPGEDTSTLVEMHSGVFVQRGKEISKDYLGVLSDLYRVEPQQVDFVKDPESSRVVVNTWVSKLSSGRIRQLFAKDSIDSDMRLILANVIFLKGLWDHVFQESQTKSRPFYLAEDKKINAMMMKTENHLSGFGYYKGRKFSALALPTEDRLLDMVIVLPDDRAGLSEIESQMTIDSVTNMFDGFENRPVTLTMPKFRFEADWKLSKTLKQMGMDTAFSGSKANFEGIDGGVDKLYLSEIAQKAVIEVQEKGFEASAATAATMKAGSVRSNSAKPIDFNVDHPFLYFIREQRTNLILFIGRVAKPEYPESA